MSGIWMLGFSGRARCGGGGGCIGRDEPVELLLEFLDGPGSGLSSQPLFEGLVESFDFPAGGRMVGSAVFLGDVEVSEGSFEPVAASFSSGESGGVDHAVVGQH